MKKLLCLFALLQSFFSGFAQDLNLKGIATNISQVGKINAKWNYNIHILSVYDTKNQIIDGKSFPAGHCHFIPHLLVNRKINTKLNVAGGFAYGRHNIFGLRENEPRIILQSTYNQKVKFLTLNHRIRFEERFPMNLKTDIQSSASIIRYQIGLNMPLYNPKNYKRGLYAFASNETFFFLKGATNGPVSSKNGGLISENWSNIGLGYNTGKDRIEFGYGYQALVRNKAKDMRYFSLFQINYHILLNFDDLRYWWYM